MPRLGASLLCIARLALHLPVLSHNQRVSPASPPPPTPDRCWADTFPFSAKSLYPSHPKTTAEIEHRPHRISRPQKQKTPPLLVAFVSRRPLPRIKPGYGLNLLSSFRVHFRLYHQAAPFLAHAVCALDIVYSVKLQGFGRHL